jgi:lysophospholipase L1-like esterase
MTSRRFACGLLALIVLVSAAAGWAGFRELRKSIAETRLAQTLDYAPGGLVPAAPVTWPEDAERILVIGDSRIARWQPRPDAPGRHLHFAGLGGETTGQLRRRMVRDLTSLAPEKVIIAAGINDLVAASLNPAHAAVVVAGVVDNLEAISDAVRARGGEVILLTILRPAPPDPLRRVFAWSDSLPALVASTNDRLRALDAPEQGVRVLDVDALIGGDPVRPLPGEFAADTLHLTSTAYDRLNILLVEALGE